MVYGEKFIQKKIEGNKVIIISEYKEFPIDFENIANTINDSISDDWECQFNDYGLTMGYNGDWYSIDVDSCLEGLNEYLESVIESYESKEAYLDEEGEWIQDLIDQLETAKGYVIYDRSKDDYSSFKPEDE